MINSLSQFKVKDFYLDGLETNIVADINNVFIDFANSAVRELYGSVNVAGDMIKTT